MEQLEAEAIFLAWPFNEFTGAEYDCPNPMTTLCLLGSIEQQQSWFEHTPELRPAFEGAADLQPVSENDDCLVFESEIFFFCEENLPHFFVRPAFFEF